MADYIVTTTYTTRVAVKALSEAHAITKSYSEIRTYIDHAVQEAFEELKGIIGAGHLDVEDAWVHLTRHRLLIIRQTNGRIRRREGSGCEYNIKDLSFNTSNATEARATISQADLPSQRLNLLTAELLAEFEEVR